MSLLTTARKNLLERIRTNTYPGRGTIIGLDGTNKHVVQVSWMMGRSDGSRNRKYLHEHGRVYTWPARPSGVGNPELTLYNAMREKGRHFVVSNGKQTDEILDGLAEGRSFHSIVTSDGIEYEPDKPIWTSRISAACSLDGKPKLHMARHRRGKGGRNLPEYWYLGDQLRPGFGFCLTTYLRDGNPPPAFVEDPFILPLEGEIQRIADAYWSALDGENRVALAVKFVDTSCGTSRVALHNRYA